MILHQNNHFQILHQLKFGTLHPKQANDPIFQAGDILHPLSNPECTTHSQHHKLVYVNSILSNSMVKRLVVKAKNTHSMIFLCFVFFVKIWYNINKTINKNLTVKKTMRCSYSYNERFDLDMYTYIFNKRKGHTASTLNAHRLPPSNNGPHIFLVTQLRIKIDSHKNSEPMGH
uniref:Uncharacterized protein n=1 Tax=Rhizophora mucronata TaxID=61149 RepID=A0A2P2PQZ2_RHIMU